MTLVARVSVIVWVTLGAAPARGASPEGVEFFEKHVRPVLVERCYSCHSAAAKTVKGGYRVDGAAALLKGGESGVAAVVPGEVEKSRLIEAVRYGNADLQMPPKERLTAREVRALEEWVGMGAPVPEDGRDDRGAKATLPVGGSRDFWSFKRPKAVAAPAVKGAAWCANEVDRFVLAKLEEKGLKPSAEADRRTLVRRATYDLHGLPPAPAEVEAFVADASADAYPKLIDRLLASPRYGERWGRYWLDLARYSDTKGYVYDREEKQFVHAHNYRDWVIGALNDDVPYDRFLMLQLAGDQVGGEKGEGRSEKRVEGGNSARARDLAAMGFLTVGRRFLGVPHDIIDDRIDVTMRTTQGLTVACARCHDHKFDPIPTADYYSLYGVFAGGMERAVCLDDSPAPTEAYKKYEKGLRERTDKLEKTFAAKKEELFKRLRAQAGEYLAAVTGVTKLPDDLFYALLGPEEMNPIVVRQWQQYLFERGKSFDPVWAVWTAVAGLGEAEFATKAPAAIEKALGNAGVSKRVAAAFAGARPASMGDVARVYGKLLAAANVKDRPADAADAALWDVLYGAGSPVRVPPGSMADTEWFFPEGDRVALDKLQADVERWNINTPGAPPYALIVEDRPEQVNPRVFKRGNPSTKGPEVPRRFLSAIAGDDAAAFAHGSGRLEMARAIASKENPLTARVMVNRVWGWHFGTGLVNTPSDFGARSERPSHPELLDWLAVRFMESGWSIKAMHRLVMNSAAYRQASADDAAAAAAVDPENRLLWRMNRARLDFEAGRDSLLAASGELDLTAGGRPVDVNGNRRTVYAKVDRQFLPGVFRAFDFASPDLHMPQRATTTVPQQALYFMNASFVTGRARALAGRAEVAREKDDAARVRALYRIVYQREPTPRQVEAGVAFVGGAVAPAGSAKPQAAKAASAWKYGYGEYDAGADRVKGFAALPHFAGGAWQGGAAWPDARLGWVQLTAAGGHAGNDMAHAAVRRWVAPRDMVVRIEGDVAHEYAAGKGIGARVVSSRAGTLGQWRLHNSRASAAVGRVEVRAGDTIDFVVDFAGALNSNMFAWSPVVAEAGGKEVWSCAGDFEVGGTRSEVTEALGAWEAYAHVLLMSNEFLFVD